MEAIAYLALEIKQRELDSRLLIAAHLLKAGIPVVFGQQWALFANVDKLPRGVILFKTVNHIQAMNMANFHKLGYLVAATDEEVLVCTEDACFFEVFSELAATTCDLFFAQSAVHQEATERRFPALKGKVSVAGNARVDFLSPHGRASFSAEAQQLAQTHGPYILFNTNFGQMNSIWTETNQVLSIAAKAGLVNLNDPDSVTEYKAKLEWERRNMEEMVNLLEWAVTNIHGYKLVLRPHPGEHMAFWEQRLGQHRNVLIVPRSNPHPWLLGASLVVHTSCTTGLEGALLDKPVLNLVPIPHPSFDYVTNSVNPTVKNWQDAAAAISAFVTSQSGPIMADRQKFAAVLDAHFPDHALGISTQKIADGLVSLLRQHNAPPVQDIKTAIKNSGYQRVERSGTMKDKFTVSPEELVQHLQNVMTVMGQTTPLDVRLIDDSLFLISLRH